MKPIFKIIAVVLVLILLGVGIYLGWRKIIQPSPEGPTGNGGITPPAGVGVSETTSLKKVSDNPVFDYWVYGDDIYYLGVDGRVFVAKNDTDTEVSREVFNALNTLRPSPDGSAILVSFGDPTNPNWGVFDSRDKVWRPLNPNILNAGWGGDDETVFAVIRSGNALNLSEIDLLKPLTPKVLIRDFRLKDVDIFWKPPQALLFAEKPSVFYSSRLWQLDLKTLTFNLLMAAEKGMVIEPANAEGLIFKFSLPKNLSFLDVNLKSLIAESTFFTLPSKCWGSATQVYCFEPQIIPENAHLPDDYFQKKFRPVDDLFSLDIQKYELKKLLASNKGGRSSNRRF